VISLFELFKIGIGPSSSHTVGPMKAAKAFVDGLATSGRLSNVARVTVTLFGSLAWTGKGHGTDKAVLLGLMGAEPATVDPDEADRMIAIVRGDKALLLPGRAPIAFDLAHDLVFDTLSPTPSHPNTMSFAAFDASGHEIVRESWLSVGGGFVVREGDSVIADGGAAAAPYAFRNSAEMIAIGDRTGLSIAEIVMANELAQRPREAVVGHLRGVAGTMLSCIDRGLATSGELPGGLKVKRRAPAIYAQLQAARGANSRSAHEIMDFISVFAIAVNEENAAGGRVVTAPTNGAAGVVPAVLRYYRDFCIDASLEGMDAFLLTAAAIGALFKMNASISGAEVGCQGEVGVACSMAAAGLAAALGAANAQIENAAEIGMEHHLGMTCDPIGGLVQIPCIERNAFGAIKAVNAASLAMRGDGTHLVSLDQVIATMRQTGADMHDKYKETSRGGLAVNWIEC
jgi:L-serine dehydratase